jgi:small subunit ribosomal protein S17
MARTLIGTVVSDKADKTIVIAVHTSMRHPIYRKQYSITKKFIAHDEQNAAHIGDSVEITEGRPISARKRFTMTRIIESAKITHKEDTVAPAAEAEETK